MLFMAYWWFYFPKGALRWSYPLIWGLYPAAYLIYALARGAIIGSYPYGFIDPIAIGYQRTMINAVGSSNCVYRDRTDLHGVGPRPEARERMSADFRTLRTPQRFNSVGAGKLPGHLGIVITEVSESRVSGELPVVEAVLAPNGYLHAGAVVALADTCLGIRLHRKSARRCIGFTTIELKSNHLGTTLDGTIIAVATPVHRGRSTQVWDAVVTTKSPAVLWPCFAAPK